MFVLVCVLCAGVTNIQQAFNAVPRCPLSLVCCTLWSVANSCGSLAAICWHMLLRALITTSSCVDGISRFVLLLLPTEIGVGLEAGCNSHLQAPLFGGMPAGVGTTVLLPCWSCPHRAPLACWAQPADPCLALAVFLLSLHSMSGIIDMWFRFGVGLSAEVCTYHIHTACTWHTEHRSAVCSRRIVSTPLA